MKIEQIKVENLKPYEKNARIHSEEQISQIKQSIIEFGFTNPILIDKHNEIIAGHGRLESAKQLKMKDVPCIKLGYLSETQKKALVIADNKIATNARWNDKLLIEEIETLIDENFDVTILGWGEDLPEYASEPDYSILEEQDISKQLNELNNDVKRALQIEFDKKDYEDAKKITAELRRKKIYIGGIYYQAIKEKYNEIK